MAINVAGGRCGASTQEEGVLHRQPHQALRQQSTAREADQAPGLSRRGEPVVTMLEGSGRSHGKLSATLLQELKESQGAHRGERRNMLDNLVTQTFKGI